MGQILVSLFAGTLFGAGLAVSQMIDPARVIGFLDVAGRWDPTLALVMVGALAITVPAFALARRKGVSPILGETFRLPTSRDIDGPLLLGAALFGIGWGLSGFCPGPAIAALSTGLWPVIAFGLSMVVGMVLYEFLGRTKWLSHR
jgi:uncharacterized membrane protein YedE/YeeE